MRREGGREVAVDESSTEWNRRVDDSLINGSLSLFSMYAASQGVCLPGVKIPEMSMGAREARECVCRVLKSRKWVWEPGKPGSVCRVWKSRKWVWEPGKPGSVSARGLEFENLDLLIQPLHEGIWKMLFFQRYFHSLSTTFGEEAPMV